MKELVDLYSKLVIGTFTFLGPSFTLLISIFYRQLDRGRERNQERLKNLVALNSEDNRSLTRQIRKNQRVKNLFNPKRQVIRLFGALLAALVFITFYYFQQSHFWSVKREWVRCITLLVSFALYSYCLFSLWQVFCVIINAKIEDEEENKQRKITLEKA